MPRIDEVLLDATKDQPTVEIIFGQAHVGNYRFFLWDAAGRNPQELSHGTNTDGVVDKFGVGADARALHEKILGFEGIVQAADARSGNVYSVTVTVRQGDDVCSGGLIQETGAFDDVKALLAFRRFRTS
jgi:hypothetical protein